MRERERELNKVSKVAFEFDRIILGSLEVNLLKSCICWTELLFPYEKISEVNKKICEEEKEEKGMYHRNAKHTKQEKKKRNWRRLIRCTQKHCIPCTFFFLSSVRLTVETGFSPISVLSNPIRFRSTVKSFCMRVYTSTPEMIVCGSTGTNWPLRSIVDFKIHDYILITLNYNDIFIIGFIVL